MNGIRENASTYQVKGQSLSVSLGYSIMDSRDGDLAAYLKLSDENMYQDKKRKKQVRQEK